VTQPSAFNLFLIALWWPLIFLPGARWEDMIAPMGLSLFGLMLRALSRLPSERERWRDIKDRHRVPWQKVMWALIGLEAVLLAFILIFASSREQTEPFAGWLAPLAATLIGALPKFSAMADKLIEMGVPERVNPIVVAWGIAYVAQVGIAALWVPPAWRRLREGPLPPERANLTLAGKIWLSVLCVLSFGGIMILAILHPEASETRGRKELFHEFETRDSNLLYRVVFNSTMYWQSAFFCLVSPFAYFRRRRPQRFENRQPEPLISESCSARHQPAKDGMRRTQA
jgi:hypothetical protein